MSLQWSARRPLTLGYAAIVLLLGGLGAWGFGTEIAGAVIAPGTVRVESERQVVEHPDGGVVGEILARDGDRVRAGDLLIRLDGTFIRSELAVVEGQLAEIHARTLRLAAERDGANELVAAAPPAFTQIGPDAVSEQERGQEALFHARLASLRQEQEALREQSAQIDRQIDGHSAQLDALARQLEIAGGELGSLRTLLDKGLVPTSRVLELEREDARLRGEIGRLTALEAEARTRQSSIRIEALRLLDARREDAISRLRDIGLNRIELDERRRGLIERLQRLDLRAPADGIVFGSQIFAIGSVVRPADPVMFVIPGGQPLTVAARIEPTDVEQIRPGQPVSLVLSTYSRRTTPEIAGTVRRISADAVTDRQTGRTYYEAIVTPDAEALAALVDVSLLPGMPVETYFRTGERSPVAYLLQPLTIYFSRALREE